MTLYHITTVASAGRILSQGLRPRIETKKKTLYGTHMPSIPWQVYLGRKKVIQRIQREFSNKPHIYINLVGLEIDLDGLESNLRPDEDWLNDYLAIRNDVDAVTLYRNASRLGYDIRCSNIDDRKETRNITSDALAKHIRNYDLMTFKSNSQELTVTADSLEGRNGRDLKASEKLLIADVLSCFWPRALKDMGAVEHKGAIPADRIRTVSL